MICRDERNSGSVGRVDVPTDNWRVQFRYISRRLVLETVQQHEAADAALGDGVRVDLDLGPVSLQPQQRPPDYGNPADLALRATAAVRGLTGTIQQPGEYLRTTLTFAAKACYVGLGWDDPRRDGWPIAGFFADEDVAGMRVFVALFGSITNLYAWQDAAPVGGHTPSDAAGLYLILNSVLEDEDPGISQESTYQYHEHLQSSPGERLWAARLMRAGTGHAFRPEPLDLLVQVFVCERGVNIRHVEGDDLLAPADLVDARGELDGDPYDLAIIGAPLWAATPERDELESYLAAKERAPEPSAPEDGQHARGRIRGILDRFGRQD
jgi:hypothetical protein